MKKKLVFTLQVINFPAAYSSQGTFRYDSLFGSYIIIGVAIFVSTQSFRSVPETFSRFYLHQELKTIFLELFLLK